MDKKANQESCSFILFFFPAHLNFDQRSGFVAIVTFAFMDVAMPATFTSSATGTSASIWRTTTPFCSPEDSVLINALFRSPSSLDLLVSFAFTKYLRSLLIVTVTFCNTVFEVLLVGRFTGKPDGVTKLEVSIKKINRRNIMSVMEDILNPASILFFDFRSISGALEGDQ